MADPPTEKKKSFGEKLKGVGKAIGRGVKKVPGIAYRDVVKPYGEHIASKFTEPTVRKVSLKRRVTPGGVEAYRAEKTTVSREEAPTVKRYRAEQRTRLKRPPRKATPGQGRTTAYDPAFTGSKSAVERLSDISHLAGPIKRLPIGMGRKAGKGKKRTTKKKVISPTPETAATRREQAERTVKRAGAEVGEYVEVVGGIEPRDPPGRPRMKRKARVKFSPKKTGATLRKAAQKRQEQMAAVPPADTTAAEMARMMTEQELAREAQRTESELKGGRKPTREKARYRLRTRGLKRSEGRGR